MGNKQNCPRSFTKIGRISSNSFTRCSLSGVRCYLRNSINLFEGEQLLTLRFFQEGLSEALDAIIERSQDFTDSANTSHEHRERILDYINSAKMHLDALLNSECAIDGTSPSEETERTVESLLTNLRDLRKQLQETSFAQVILDLLFSF